MEIDVFQPGNQKIRLGSPARKNYYDFGIDAFWLDNSEPDFGVYDFDHYRYIDGPALSCSNIYPSCTAVSSMTHESRRRRKYCKPASLRLGRKSEIRKCCMVRRCAEYL